MTHLIVLLGFLTIVLSLVVAAKFMYHGQCKSRGVEVKRLSLSLTGQLIGEAVIGVGTLAFAILAHTGQLQHMSVEAQSFMRLSMFLATSATTAHLWITIKKIEK